MNVEFLNNYRTSDISKMSLVWTIIASFLYIEIGIVLLFVLPVASATRWQRFFRSRFLAMLTGQAQMYFYLLLGILVLFLLEAIREMRKYSNIGKYFLIENRPLVKRTALHILLKSYLCDDFILQKRTSHQIQTLKCIIVCVYSVLNVISILLALRFS